MKSTCTDYCLVEDFLFHIREEHRLPAMHPVTPLVKGSPERDVMLRVRVDVDS